MLTSGRAIFFDLPKKGQRIGVPNFFQFPNRYNWNKTFLNHAVNFSNSSVAHRKVSYGSPVGHGPLVEKPWSKPYMNMV